MVRSPARARWGAWARAARPLGRESGVCPGRKGIAGVGALARLREEARVRERDGVRNRGTGAAVQPPCRGRRAGRAPGRAAASLPPSRWQGRRTCTAAGSRRSPRVLPRLRGPASVPVTLARCGSTWSGPARHPPPPPESVAGPTPSGSGAEPSRRCRPPRRRRCSPVMPPVPPPPPPSRSAPAPGPPADDGAGRPRAAGDCGPRLGGTRRKRTGQGGAGRKRAGQGSCGALGRGRTSRSGGGGRGGGCGRVGAVGGALAGKREQIIRCGGGGGGGGGGGKPCVLRWAVSWRSGGPDMQVGTA